MPDTHARLPPSGAGAWVNCAQWPTMNALYPSVDDEDTLEGRAGHWALSERLVGRQVAVGQVTPDDYVLDADMVKHADITARWVDTLVPPSAVRHVETKVDISAIHLDNFGTPDLFALTSAHRLVVFDYKYGYGYVDVFENWQLLDYVRGVLDYYGVSSVDDASLTIVFAIAQPRNFDREGPFRVWEVNASELRPYWNRLTAAAESASNPTRVATPGEHCLHCPGRLHCPTLQRSAYRVLKVVGDGTPFDLPVDVAARELTQLTEARVMLDARISGLTAELGAAYDRGERGFGYVLDQSPGRQYWTADAEHVIGLGQLYGLDLKKPVEVITPVQAIETGLPKTVVGQYSRRALTEPKLVKTEKSFAHRAFFKKA